MNQQDILQAFHFRHACKAYDPNRRVADGDMRFILETGRLSPSSFGFEPWKFVVVQNRALREKIRDMAWGAKDKIMDCSHFVLILVRQPQDLAADSDYITHIMRDVHGLPADALELRRGFYRAYSQNDADFADKPRACYDWACKQSYIALGNMMTAAAMIGVDSTAVEGFPYDAVDRMLADEGVYDAAEFKISVMAAFGYRLHEPRAKTRQAFDDVVAWID